MLFFHIFRVGRLQSSCHFPYQATISMQYEFLEVEHGLTSRVILQWNPCQRLREGCWAHLWEPHSWPKRISHLPITQNWSHHNGHSCPTRFWACYKAEKDPHHQVSLDDQKISVAREETNSYELPRSSLGYPPQSLLETHLVNHKYMQSLTQLSEYISKAAEMMGEGIYA